MRALLILFAFVWAGSTLAQTDDDRVRLQRVEAAFAEWLDALDAKGILALRRSGRALGTVELGLTSDSPVELASLSKAITGVCAQQLVQLGLLNWSDTVGGLLGQGPDTSLEELITHGSGLKTDSTQQIMLQTLDSTHQQGRAVLDAVVARDGPLRAPGKFRYNNENYALAGLMIEAATERDYQDVCQEISIEPAGVSAQSSHRTGGYLPWGGWQMTVEDYAVWHAFWFGDARTPGSDALSLPNIAVTDVISYGVGTFFRAGERGSTFWHFGAQCFPGRLNAGSYVATLFADWTVVAAYDVCVTFEQMFALDQAVLTAMFGTLE